MGKDFQDRHWENIYTGTCSVDSRFLNFFNSAALKYSSWNFTGLVTELKLFRAQ